MNREDSGVIDLFAMQRKAAERARADEVVPADLFSAPPPAFTTDLYSDPGLASFASKDDGDDDDDSLLVNPFAKKSRKNLGFIAGGIGALMFFGIVIATVSGGSAEAPKAAGARSALTITPLPTAAARPVEAPPIASSASIAVPPPPTTGATASKPPPPRAIKSAAPSKARAAAPSGPKLTKIQSGGVAAK